MDRNHLNIFERGSTKDHSCEIWSKSNQWFRRRCCLKIVNGRTDRRTTTTTTDGEWSQYLTLSLRLRWANKRQRSNKPSHHPLLLLGDFHLESKPSTACYWSDLAVSWHTSRSAIPRPVVVLTQNKPVLSNPLYCWRPPRWYSGLICC